jgi:peptide/nickel transport system substrate-binding protein
MSTRTRRSRTVLAAATGLALAATLTACTAKGSSTASGSGSGSKNIVFTEPLPDTSSADPVDSTAIDNLQLIRGAYEGLVGEVTGTYDVKPVLATKWTKSADNKTWTFTLRQGVKFSDGTAFDSAAVLANVARYQKLGGQVGGLLVGAKATAPDANTVTFTLDSANGGFLSYLALVVFVSPKALTDHAGSDDAHSWLVLNTDGTVPYKSPAALTGTNRKLVRNDSYWGGWKDGQINTVQFVTAADAATQIQQVQRGEVDRVLNIPLGPYLKQFSSNKDLTVLRSPGTQIDEIQMNTQSGPLKNKLLRQAVTYAYDYSAGIEAAYDGFATAPSGPLPAGYSGADASATPYKQDLAKAKALLAQSGEKNVKLSLWWATPAASYEQPQSAVVKDSLAKIGIDVTVKELSFDAMAKGAASPKSAPDLNFLWHGAITADPVEYLGSYFDSRYIGGYNWSFYNNPKFDAALKAASAAATTDERDKILAEAQQTVVADAPTLFTAVPERIEVISSRFTGFKIHPIDYGYAINFYELRAKS